MTLGDTRKNSRISWGKRATIVALGANIFLISLKISIGLLMDSLSLIADGFDSGLDVFTALMAYIGFWIAQRPPDEGHHYGHHQLEALLSLGITGLLFLSSFAILTQGFTRFVLGTMLEYDILGLVTAIISILTKTSIAFYIIGAGKLAESPAIVANGKNYRTDAITSSFVAIAMIGAFFGLGWLDTLVALLICLFIIFTGLEISKTSLTSLLDMAPTKSTIDGVLACINSIPGIKEAHKLRLRYLGSTIVGDCHVLVNPEMSIKEAHDLAEKIEFSVEKKCGIKGLIIHLEPFLPEQTKYS